MKQVPVQTDNVTQLIAADFNPIPRETENAIKAQSIALDNSGVNVSQLAEAISEAVTVNDLYQDSGAANAYILSPISQRKSITKYIDGMALRFEPAFDNTTDSTVDVNSLGVKSVFLQSGAEIPAGTLLAGVTYQIQYDLENDRFFILTQTPTYLYEFNYTEPLGNKNVYYRESMVISPDPAITFPPTSGLTGDYAAGEELVYGTFAGVAGVSNVVITDNLGITWGANSIELRYDIENKTLFTQGDETVYIVDESGARHWLKVADIAALTSTLTVKVLAVNIDIAIFAELGITSILEMGLQDVQGVFGEKNNVEVAKEPTLIDRTYTNYTPPARQYGVTYANLHHYEIIIYIATARDAASSILSFVINGVTVFGGGRIAGATTYSIMQSIVVPPFATYLVTTSKAFGTWSELS